MHTITARISPVQPATARDLGAKAKAASSDGAIDLFTPGLRDLALPEDRGAGVGGFQGIQEADHGGRCPTVRQKFASGAKCAALGAGIAAATFAVFGAFLSLGMYNVPVREILIGMGGAGSMLSGAGAGLGFHHGWNRVGRDQTEH